MAIVVTGAQIGNVLFNTFSGYTYYRWKITAIRTPGTANSVQASEFVFQIGGVDQTATTDAATVSNPGGNNPATETPAKLIDNNLSTKWLDFNMISNGYSDFIFQFSSAQSFTGYRWATGNDATERDPISWTISGSNDGTNWTTLSTVTNFATTTSRSTWNTASVI